MYEILLILLALMLFLYVNKYQKYKQLKFLYDRTTLINQTIIKISEDMSSFQDIDEFYKQILKDTIGLIEGADAGSILIYNKETNLLEFKAAVLYDLNALKKVLFSKEEVFLYRTTGLKAPEIISTPHKFDKDYVKQDNIESLKEANSSMAKSCISAPLYVNGEFYGIVNIDSTNDENAFNRRDISLIQYICRQLELTIKNVILVNELTETLRIDKLTGIYNRRYFEEIIEKRLQDVQTLGENLVLVMIDMDNFKMVNDSFGHKAGDEALKIFATKLTEFLGNKDIAARFAGDEFVILSHNTNEFEVERRIKEIENYFSTNPVMDTYLAFSSGLSIYKQGMGYEELLVQADNNMYEKKRIRKIHSNGKLCV